MVQGVILTLDQVWQLSQLWYHNRLDEAYHGRSAAEAEAIFAQVGLHGSFWRM